MTIGTSEDKQDTGGSAEPGDPAHCNSFSITGPTLEWCAVPKPEHNREAYRAWDQSVK